MMLVSKRVMRSVGQSRRRCCRRRSCLRRRRCSVASCKGSLLGPPSALRFLRSSGAAWVACWVSRRMRVRIAAGVVRRVVVRLRVGRMVVVVLLVLPVIHRVCPGLRWWWQRGRRRQRAWGTLAVASVRGHHRARPTATRNGAGRLVACVQAGQRVRRRLVRRSDASAAAPAAARRVRSTRRWRHAVVKRPSHRRQNGRRQGLLRWTAR